VKEALLMLAPDEGGLLRWSGRKYRNLFAEKRSP
jgi:hypothetical protein